jgi:hypothetical protein
MSGLATFEGQYCARRQAGGVIKLCKKSYICRQRKVWAKLLMEKIFAINNFALLLLFFRKG